MPVDISFEFGRLAIQARRIHCSTLGHLAHHTNIMKTLLTLVGLATSCLLSGCAHDTRSKAASKPEAVAVAGQSVTFTVTNTGDQPFIYQVNGTNVGGATVPVTNR